MSKLDEICQRVVSDVDGALATALVDLDTGMLTGSHHTVPYFTQTYLDAVAAAAVDMFRGKTVSRVEDLLSKQRGDDTKHLVKEVQMTTDNTFHFMSIVPGKESTLMVLITQKSTNLGMGWSGLRAALKDVASA
ncbi:MAG: hypothetical protein OEZ10_01490 [Gammaproteobacteria bacterium]|nr:hypothetical protein [Gammaproteobacteria bacterium]